MDMLNIHEFMNQYVPGFDGLLMNHWPTTSRMATS